MTSQYDVLARAADAVAARLGRGSVGVVLGSGLSEVLDYLDHPRFMDYAEIPGMPGPSTAGHRGSLLAGRCGEVDVLALCGRIHLYEDRPHQDVATPVRLLSMLGVHTLVVTSAVGSTDPEVAPGDIVLVEDHINLTGRSVLAGDHDPRLGERFTDLSCAYEPRLIRFFEETAQVVGARVHRGVLAQFLGPTYETPAEVRMARSFGARVVSMSMVPEVVTARQRGMRVAGIACVTNLAAGLDDRPLDHQDVLRTSAGLAGTLQDLLSGTIPRLASRERQPAASSGLPGRPS